MSIDTVIANASRSLKLNSFDGNRAREIRKKAGLTQDGLARLCGYSGKNPRDMIKKFESGEVIPRGIRGTAGRKYISWVEKNCYRLNK
ncbi:MAG TPA: helix-turn-helix transcriptional regulator [Candidatus Nanoarchaeia archaeon]|nr:helix-turn-helix transcriptional regulator [Candidatus Nanoarchaeia archaeon]